MQELSSCLERTGGSSVSSGTPRHNLTGRLISWFDAIGCRLNTGFGLARLVTCVHVSDGFGWNYTQQQHVISAMVRKFIWFSMYLNGVVNCFIDMYQNKLAAGGVWIWTRIAFNASVGLFFWIRLVAGSVGRCCCCWLMFALLQVQHQPKNCQPNGAIMPNCTYIKACIVVWYYYTSYIII